MTTAYPGGIDPTSTLENDRNNASVTANDHATQHDNLSDAVIAVETALGTNPKGTYTDVKTRLNDALYKTPTAAQIVSPGGDYTGLAVKANVGLATANVFEGQDNTGAIKFYVDKNFKVSAQGYLLNGSPLTSSALADGPLAPLASPALTGSPVAPTASVDTSTTQLATTAFVLGQAAAATPLMNGVAAVGSSTRYARADHVHATDTALVAKVGSTMTGKLTVAAAGIGFNDGTTQTSAAVSTIVATSVAGLGGSPSNGAAGLLRTGSAPFAYLPLVFDFGLARWIGPEWSVVVGGSSEYGIDFTNQRFSVIQELTRNYGRMVTAGLKLQYRFTFRASSDQSSFAFLTLDFCTATPQAVTVTAANPWSAFTTAVNSQRIPSVGNLTTTLSFYGLVAPDETAWADLPGGLSPSADILGARLTDIPNASPSQTRAVFDNMTFALRWVSA